MVDNIVTLHDRPMGDPVADLMRLRGTPKSPKVKKCEAVSELLCKVAEKFGLKSDYDQSNMVDVSGLRHTEIFASLGGVIIGPKCTDRALLLLSHAVLTDRKDSQGGVTDNVDFISDMTDKYSSINFDYDYPEKVIILPGSNLLESCVDKIALNEAFDQGAHIKPHPMTNRKHRTLLTKEYGSRLIPPNYSGVNVIKNAKVVYTSGSSELTLLALLLDKTIIEIGQGDPLGGYLTIWKFLSMFQSKRYYLNRLLNSPSSGIFFPHSTEKDMAEFFESYLKVCHP